MDYVMLFDDMYYIYTSLKKYFLQYLVTFFPKILKKKLKFGIFWGGNLGKLNFGHFWHFQFWVSEIRSKIRFWNWVKVIGHYRVNIGLKWSSQDIVRTLSGHCQGIVRTLSAHVRTLSGCVRMLSGHVRTCHHIVRTCQNVVRTCQNSIFGIFSSWKFRFLEKWVFWTKSVFGLFGHFKKLEIE